MKTIITFLLFLLLSGCTNDKSEFTVELEKIIEDAESVENFHGMSNIFFQPVSDEFSYSDKWQKPEIALLSDADGYKPVYILRYETSDGKTKYLADTDSDSDFTDEAKLNFIDEKDQSIADVLINLHAKNDNHTMPVNFQVVKIQDWRYGRISEYRQGKISLNGEEYDVKMYPGTRNHPIYETTPWLNFLVDLNQDGKFSNDWQISDGGQLLSSEKIEVTRPFVLDNQTFRIASIDSTGEVISLEKSEQDSAAVENFKIPNFKTTTLEGYENKLYSYLAKPTILEFWSTSCPYSEEARPKINQLYESHADQFNLISTPREKDVDEIENHLENHPKKGILLRRNDKTWEELNPLPVSPLYYLIDSNGEVVMKTQGASAVELLELKLNQIITKGS